MRLKTRLVSRIKELRIEKNNTTQQELAEAIGVSRQTISYIESGEYNPSLKIAHDIAGFFGKSIDDIFDYEPVIKIKREEFNLTQEQLAMLIGVSIEEIKKLENDDYFNEEPPEFLEKVVKQLNCEIDDLFEDYD